MQFRQQLTCLLLILGFAMAHSTFAQTSAQQNETQDPAASTKININTANAEALAEALDGVGLSRARSIIEWRETNGPFQDPYDLVQVRGISERIVTINEDRIRVTEEPESVND